MQRLEGLLRKAVQDYEMIAPGDRVCVGVSGGKDSVALTVALGHLRRYLGVPFEVMAVTLDPRFGGVEADYQPLADLFAQEGIPYEIVDFQHFKPGKGGAMVRTKLRNILTGRMQDITFRSGEKVGKPDLETRDMQFLYRQDDELIFMDMTNYEQLQMAAASTGGKEGFLKDGQECRVLLYKSSPLDIDIPLSLVLEVTETEPGAKGDTVSNVTKAAKLETGLTVQVPIFVNTGDRIKVDTRTKEYLGRE